MEKQLCLLTNILVNVLSPSLVGRIIAIKIVIWLLEVSVMRDLPNLERIIAGEHSGLYQVDGVYPMKPFCMMSVFLMTSKYVSVMV